MEVLYIYFLTYVKGKLLAETLCNPSFAFILYRFPHCGHWCFAFSLYRQAVRSFCPGSLLRALVFCIQFVSALAYPAGLAGGVAGHQGMSGNIPGDDRAGGDEGIAAQQFFTITICIAFRYPEYPSTWRTEAIENCW
jgi:hypothetical protein